MRQNAISETIANLSHLHQLMRDYIHGKGILMQSSIINIIICAMPLSKSYSFYFYNIYLQFAPRKFVADQSNAPIWRPRLH